MSIRMKALTSFLGPEGQLHAGQEFNARDEARARYLESHKPPLAVPVPVAGARLGVKSSPPAPEVKAAPAMNKAADAGPLRSTGGRTGEVAPQPSLAQAPRPRKARRSRKGAAK